MHKTYRIIVAVVCPIVLLGVLGLPMPGWGLTLEEAKAQGLVGEKPNGYVGVVPPNAPADVQALTNDINQKRRQTYEDIARRNATSLKTVEMLAAETAIKNTKPGHFVQMPSGQWMKK